MQDCVFCKLLRKEIPSKVLFEDSQAVAFQDLHPQAPTHVLIVPRKHLSSLNDCTSADDALLGHALAVAKEVAQQQGVGSSGYRIVLNTGEGAGQTVFHIHFHLLGGRTMSWPPG
jgi:histidine triad (HIT) family protein